MLHHVYECSSFITLKLSGTATNHRHSSEHHKSLQQLDLHRLQKLTRVYADLHIAWCYVEVTLKTIICMARCIAAGSIPARSGDTNQLATIVSRPG